MALEIRTLTATRAEAQQIAHELVHSGLCACAHLDEVESSYRWQGRVEHGPEFRLMLLCREELFEQVRQVILRHHSYEEPGIYAFRVAEAPDSYRRWIAENSQAATG